MRTAYPQVSRETFDSAVETMCELARRQPQISERTFEIVQQLAEKMPEHAERMPFAKDQRIKGERQILLRLLRAKFPDLPERVVRQVETMADEEELDELAERVVTAQTLAELDMAK